MPCLVHLAAVLSSLLVAPVGGLRADADADDAVAAPAPTFSFNLKDVLCTDPTPEQFMRFFAAHPEVMERVKKEGSDLANFHNCRLCTVAAQQGAWAEAKITCSPRTEEALTGGSGSCLAGNGRTGWRQGAHACLPCPDECGGCAPPGLMDASYLSSRWFRCVLPAEGAVQPPAMWRCEAPRERRSHPGQFQFCKYRSDLLSTATDGQQPSSRTSWDVKLAAAPCSESGYSAVVADPQAEGGPDPLVRGIITAVGPKLAKAFEQNCAFCSVTAGGRLSHVPNGGAPSASSAEDFWADGSCAHEAMGVHACRHDRGFVGWSPTLCQPCPTECLECKDESSWMSSKKSFNCKLAPSTPVLGLLGQVFDAGSQAAGDEGAVPSGPAGYECGKPVKRLCSSGSGVCSGYKVSCKYRTFED